MRVGGYKGVWYVDRQLEGLAICFRPSQHKIKLCEPFDPEQLKLEVVEIFGI